MVVNHFSLGIDFRKEQLILCLLQKSWKGIGLRDYRILSWEGEGSEEEKLAFISNFVSQYSLNKDKIFVSLPREKVVVRFIHLPLAAKENLRQVLEYEAPKYVPLEREEICYDYHLIHQDRQGLHLAVVFAKKEVINAYLSLLKKIGLQPQAIQIPTIGALNLYFFHERADNKNALLIDLQGSFAEMNLIKEGKWQESIHFPLPAENREEKIVHIFQLSGGKEDLSGQPYSFLFGQGVDGQMISRLQNYPFFRKVSFPPGERIKTSSGTPLPVSLYASIGLPLRGLIKAPLNLNLMPAEANPKVRQMGRAFFILFISLALLLSFSWLGGRYKQVREELENLRAEVSKLKPEVEAIEKLKKEHADLIKEIAEFDKITSGGIKKIEILKELSQILPPSVWIWNLKQVGMEVEISGFADSASDLLPILDRSPLFEKVEFLAPVTKERDRRLGGEKEKERFKIKMRLEKRG